METHALVIIGAGPAGLAAAVSAYDAGTNDILLLERDVRAGGILGQCIHNGFGLHRFGEELTGPEYAYRYLREVEKRGIELRTGTTVLSLSGEREVTFTSSERGIETVRAGAVILAMGCRERPRGALNTPGTRPAGIFTAGTAQKLVNIKGYLPGKRVVILGSGDIGLIMARRMTLEGAQVLAVCEIMPYSGGLARNIEQCLHDYDIPLLLSHTVTGIEGEERVSAVTIAEVDGNKNPIPGTERRIECDTLLLSVGLLPENELTRGAGIPIDPVTGGAAVDQDRMTAIEGIYSCGNVLHVHDLVDYVSEEAAIAGKAAAEYLAGNTVRDAEIAVKTGGLVRYTVPQKITKKGDTAIYFRVLDERRNVRVTVTADGKEILSLKKPKAAPGEMEKITVKGSALDGVKEITVSVTEA